jgi:23S rRNA pseudoU1915 N3-methylase RlmH
MHTILSVSDSNKHFQTPINEYLKRLGKQLRITDIKPTKHGSRTQIIASESSKLVDKVKSYKTKGCRIVLLAKE